MARVVGKAAVMPRVEGLTALRAQTTRSGENVSINPTLRRIVPAALIVVLALAFWATPARADVLPDQVPADLKSAIEQRVAADGKQYAGLCRAIDHSANIGKYCAFVLTLTPTTAEVSYGPVLSEPVAQVTFTKADGRWQAPGSGQQGPVPADLKQAIKTFVEGRGHAYAGLCTEIAQDGSNIGKYCAAVANLTTTAATISYGPVASNAITTVGFTKSSAGWAASGTPPTTVPKPPATGNSDGSHDDPRFDGGVLAVGLLLAGVFGVLTARRHGKERN